MDLIERQKAIDALNAYEDVVDTASQVFTIRGCKEAITKLPSVQPDIIHCKDCKFYSQMNRETKTGICNLTMHQNFGDDWFCAGAERKADGVDN